MLTLSERRAKTYAKYTALSKRSSGPTAVIAKQLARFSSSAFESVRHAVNSASESIRNTSIVDLEYEESTHWFINRIDDDHGAFIREDGLLVVGEIGPGDELIGITLELFVDTLELQEAGRVIDGLLRLMR